jgi:carbamate kinase
MRIVAAVGANALLRGTDQPDIEIQEHHVADAATALAPVAEQHELIVTHGTGPQFGLAYWFVEALQRELPDHEVACLLARPSVAASMITRLAAPKVVIVCAGAGDPVARGVDAAWLGGEPVVDEDFGAALLAEAVGADRLLLLTDIDAVMDGWGSAAPRPIGRAGVGWFRRHAFAPESMGPKVDAACRFVEHTGRPASVGSLEEVEAILVGRSGTEVTATPRAVG